MTPLLFHPLALLGLAAVPALVAIYLFRNVFRPRPVSSLLLWRDCVQPRQGGRRLQRLRTPLLFLLELLAILALVAAAVDPRWPLCRRRQELVLVLDDSASMAAGPAGRTPRDAALERILASCTDGRFASVRPLLAGVRPRLLPDARATRPALRAALADWSCRAPADGLDTAIATALDLAGRSGRVLVVTDRAPGVVPATGRLRWLACGAAHPNAAFVNAGRARSPEGDRAFVEIANFSDRDAQLALQAEGAVLPEAARQVSLPAGGSRKLAFALPPGSAAVRLTLPPDALAADNQVLLVAPPDRRVRVSVDLQDARLAALLRDTLAATGLLTDTPGPPDLAIGDHGVSRHKLGAGCWTLTVNPAAAGAVRAPLTFGGPFIVDTAHPLSEGLDLAGVAWGVGATNDLPGRPVVLAGNIPLLSDAEQTDGSHALYLRLLPAASTLTQTPNWPVLLWNLLSWRSTALPGPIASNLRLGTIARLGVPPGQHAAAVTRPGTAREAPLVVRRGSVQVPVEEPGLHQLSAGPFRCAFAANFLAPGESDLSGLGSGDWGNWEAEASAQATYASGAWVAALVALATGVAHLALAHRAGGEA